MRSFRVIKLRICCCSRCGCYWCPRCLRAFSMGFFSTVSLWLDVNESRWKSKKRRLLGSQHDISHEMKCSCKYRPMHKLHDAHTHALSDAPMPAAKWSAIKELLSLKIEFERSVVKIWNPPAMHLYLCIEREFTYDQKTHRTNVARKHIETRKRGKNLKLQRFPYVDRTSVCACEAASVYRTVRMTVAFISNREESRKKRRQTFPRHAHSNADSCKSSRCKRTVIKRTNAGRKSPSRHLHCVCRATKGSEFSHSHRTNIIQTEFCNRNPSGIRCLCNEMPDTIVNAVRQKR